MIDSNQLLTVGGSSIFEWNSVWRELPQMDIEFNKMIQG